MNVIEKLFPVDKARREAAFAMVDYLVFDALVGNTDRHHQNWGVILEMRLDGKERAYSFKLAPTVDHASSPGRELTDDSRKRRLRKCWRSEFRISSARGNLVWQSRAWFPIGRLDADVERPSYRFCYTQGALKAKCEAGFGPLFAFPELNAVYESKDLFPLFQNRVLSPKRSDFNEYIRWLDLDRGQADPISILAVSGGERVTDNLEVFPKIKTDADGNFTVRFFLHGLRHLGAAAMQRALNLTQGESRCELP